MLFTSHILRVSLKIQINNYLGGESVTEIKVITKHDIIGTKEGKLVGMSSGAWKAFGRTYPELNLGLKELIDNAISSLLSIKNTNVFKNLLIKIQEITIERANEEGFTLLKKEKNEFSISPPNPSQVEPETKYFLIEILDNGCGIEDFESALRIGKGTTSNDLSTLNEHGVGMKHALAFANIDNNAWEIATRDKEDLLNKVYKITSAPYSEVFQYSTCNEQTWNGEQDSTGNVIRFVTTKDVYLTIGSKVESGQLDLVEATKNLIEDIAVTYNKYLVLPNEDNSNKIKMEIEFSSSDGDIGRTIIEPRYPKFEKTIRSNCIIDLKDKEKNDVGYIDITEGFLIESHENKFYYRANLKSPRVFVYLNGRLIGDIWDSLFKEKNHNRFNKYYLEINININDKKYLPSTNATKTHFSSDDKKFRTIIQHIKENVLSPRSYEENLSEKERKERFRNLFIDTASEKNINSYTVVEEYAGAIDELGKTDLFLHYTITNDDGSQREVKNELYEFKKGSLTLMSVFQLIGYSMYMHFEDYTIKEAILVVENKSFFDSNDPGSKDYEKSKKLKNFLKKFQEKFSIKISVKTYEELGVPTTVKKA
jgi:hypothetical protein